MYANQSHFVTAFIFQISISKSKKGEIAVKIPMHYAHTAATINSRIAKIKRAHKALAYTCECMKHGARSLLQTW